MTRRHDAISGKWFDEDMERCSACYLNHGHTFVQHLDSIADFEASAPLREPQWIIKNNATLWDKFVVLRKDWFRLYADTFKLYDDPR